MGVAGFDSIEDDRYRMLLPNSGLVFTCLLATMIRLYGAIRMPNACAKV